MDEGKYKETRKLITVGRSRAITIPPEMLNHIGIENGEDCEVWLMPDTGKHGQFIAIFKKEYASDQDKK